MENIDEKKTKYFVIAIVLLILLGVILIVHFNNKSLVKVDDTKTTTTKKVEEPTSEVVTTKKVEVKKDEVAVVESVYKSEKDEETDLIYNYKLTDEILESDKLVSKPIEVAETLKENSVVVLFDISLYDANGVKKSVTNSEINVSIPITGDLVGYDEYKVVYVKDDGTISDEEFETKVEDGYIKFTTKHLSMYGIIGIKKEEATRVDLSNVGVELYLNGEVPETNNIYVERSDEVTLKVTGIEDAKVSYGFREEGKVEFTEYTGGSILSNETPYVSTVLVTVEKDGEKRVFELNSIRIYDLVADYNSKANLEKEEEILSMDSSEVKDFSNVHVILNDITEEAAESENEIETLLVTWDSAYVIDEADLSKLQLSGTLYIDTAQKVDLRTNESGEIKVDTLKKIVITPNVKEVNGEKYEIFNLNGNEYTFGKNDDGSVIICLFVEPVSDPVEEETPKVETNDYTEEFINSFDDEEGKYEIDLSIDEDKNLVIEVIDTTEVKEDDKSEEKNTENTELT